MSSRKKDELAAFPASNPWQPVQSEPAIAAAVQALARGDASEDQQKRALRFIVEQLCGTYDLSARPGGLEGDRATMFAEGKRFVGLQLVKLLKVSLGAFSQARSGKGEQG